MHHRGPLVGGFCRGVLCWLLAAILPALAAANAVDSVVVGPVSLNMAPTSADDARLDIGLVVFDPGIPEDTSSHSKLGIFPQIRKAEAQFMPVLLRRQLVASAAWGVVRVLPEADPSAELLLTGEILRSDGAGMALQIRARDATGRQWLDRVYRDEAGEQDYPVAGDGDPFIDLYRQLANDLLQARDALDPRQLQTIRQVSLLRYAASLSQDAFGSYLQLAPDGLYSPVRLPAADDPMMDRVQRIRNQQHLFIDTVDEQYANLFDAMAPTYHLWRQYGREQALYLQDYQARASSRERIGRRGTFAAMEQTYNAYKGVKIQEQDLDEMALGFNNEVAPTVMQVSGKVFRLNGTLDTQYSQWRAILRDIFSLETGLPPGS